MNVVIRTLQALSLIAESHIGLSLTQISEKLGFPLATAHRILKTLENEEFIRRDPVSLEYFPGKRIQRIASLARREGLIEAAEVSLTKLSEQFNETAMLTRMMDGRAVCVALSESRRPLHLSVSVGQAVPLHAAASARVLYSDWPEQKVQELLSTQELTQLRPDTPTSFEQVMDHLRNIREYGYDVCDNEFDYDVWATSAPVKNGNGEIVASVTLTMPRERSHPEQLRHSIIKAVIDTAQDIGSAIG